MRRLVPFLLATALLAPFAAGAVPDDNFQEVTVRPGDTLWSISQKWLKDPKRWNVILRYNKLPTQDPTVALPGMTLTVPKAEIKESLRAAKLIQAVRSVRVRAKGKAAWAGADADMDLYDGWGLRTLDKSWARVKFFGGSVLSLDPNSMAILKAPRPDDRFLELKKGAVHATVARVQTPSARVLPKRQGTKYTARIMDDLSTRVQVFAGAADVSDAQGQKSVEVSAGFYTDVALDSAPRVPVKMPKMDAELRAEVDDFGQGVGESLVKVRRAGVPAAGGGGLAADIAQMSVGIPVAAYHVQIARDRNFRTVVFERNFDAYQPMDLRQANLRDGQYWIRLAIVDLLGEKGDFSTPKPYRTGTEDEFQSLAFSGQLEVTNPPDESVTVPAPQYRITGRAGRGLQVMINGDRVAVDEDGYFSKEVLLKRGPNGFRIEASDVRGNDKVVIRRIVFEP